MHESCRIVESLKNLSWALRDGVVGPWFKSSVKMFRSFVAIRQKSRLCRLFVLRTPSSAEFRPWI